jgi:hypothetical protein
VIKFCEDAPNVSEVHFSFGIVIHYYPLVVPEIEELVVENRGIDKNTNNDKCNVG